MPREKRVDTVRRVRVGRDLLTMDPAGQPEGGETRGFGAPYVGVEIVAYHENLTAGSRSWPARVNPFQQLQTPPEDRRMRLAYLVARAPSAV